MTPASEPAVTRAILLAKKRRAELWIAHVYRPPCVSQAEAVGPGVYDEWDWNLRVEFRRRLEPWIEIARRQLVFARPLVLSGVPCRAIVGAAREIQADLIVIGSHRRRGLARFFQRSLASRVASSAPCRVITARARPDETRRVRLHSLSRI